MLFELRNLDRLFDFLMDRRNIDKSNWKYGDLTLLWRIINFFIRLILKIYIILIKRLIILFMFNFNEYFQIFLVFWWRNKWNTIKFSKDFDDNRKIQLKYDSILWKNAFLFKKCIESIKLAKFTICIDLI